MSTEYKISEQNELTVDRYKEKWTTNTKGNTAVLFLFVKEYGKSDYEFKGLTVSELLGDEHLFEKVVEFINEHLSGNHKTIVMNGSKYLARAITPVWTEAKRAEARSMLNMSKYFRYHFNFNFSGEEFLDLVATRQTLDTNYVQVYFTKNQVVNKQNVVDTLKTTLPIYLDRRIFSTKEITLKDDMEIFQIQFWLNFFKKKEKTVALIECNSKFYEFMEAMEKLQKTKKLLSTTAQSNVSTWGWNKDYSPLYPEDLIDIGVDYKFILVKETVKNIFKEGDLKQPWINSYDATYCNIFAYDLSCKILFSHSPWGKSHCANKLHWRISHNNEFKDVLISNKEDKTQKDAWTYTNAGYVVYFTAFNSDMSNDLLTTVTVEKKLAVLLPAILQLALNQLLVKRDIREKLYKPEQMLILIHGMQQKPRMFI